MAETIAALRADGLVEPQPDPTDGRKTLIHATPRGRSLSATIPAARQTWLESAVNELLDLAEQQTLRKAAAIMNRIADSDLRSPTVAPIGGRTSKTG
jgi:DNA-binding MarR family transcriptional regulator